MALPLHDSGSRCRAAAALIRVILLTTALVLQAFGGLGTAALGAAGVSDSGDIVTVSYLQLRELAEHARLQPGRRYRVSDFRTRHTIPYTKEVNTGPVEVLQVTAATATSLDPVALSESFPQDLIRYELVNALDDAAFDRGRIVYRENFQKNVASYEDWRAIKYRRGRNPATGKFTEVANFEAGFLDLYPFNNSPDPKNIASVRIGKTNGAGHANIVVGTGDDTMTYEVLIGDGCNHITIGANTRTIHIAHANGDIVIGDFSNHIRIGVCSDGVVIGDHCEKINIGTTTGPIRIKDRTTSCNVGDNASPMTLGDGNGTSHIYVGDGVVIGDSPTIAASGTLMRDRSTIPASADITGQRTLDLSQLRYAGVIHLASRNQRETLEAIRKPHEPDEVDFPVELRPGPGLRLMISAVAPETPATEGRIMLRTGVSLDGDRGDSITFKRVRVGSHDVYVETARSIY
ncbi:hypothetical protein [Geomonas paludis]|uniref:Uncharacterized protein n=1 Tax=Geomonas paludis TaxID=2740185 RepID=A0A6V8N0P9_9BACT|nr:hypothetical protein [Geomonas paludis]GFO66096.1 hypothetical protein GMPD_40150 [Geomonas paludis]